MIKFASLKWLLQLEDSKHSKHVYHKAPTTYHLPTITMRSNTSRSTGKHHRRPHHHLAHLRDSSDDSDSDYDLRKGKKGARNGGKGVKKEMEEKRVGGSDYGGNRTNHTHSIQSNFSALSSQLFLIFTFIDLPAQFHLNSMLYFRKPFLAFFFFFRFLLELYIQRVRLVLLGAVSYEQAHDICGAEGGRGAKGSA